MSRGLGRVERVILEALSRTRQPEVTLYRLTCLVAGVIRQIDDDLRESWDPWRCQCPLPAWAGPIQGPCPPIVHEPSCLPPRPARTVQNAVGRAVQSLARKRLVVSTTKRRSQYGHGAVVRLPTEADQAAWRQADDPAYQAAQRAQLAALEAEIAALLGRR